MEAVEQFEVETDAAVYLPGAVVSGYVRLRTKEDIPCSGVSIEALGEAHCIIDSASAAETHGAVYYRSTKTLFGNTYQTAQAERIDSVFRFDTPSVGDGGRLQVPYHTRRGKKVQLQLVGMTGKKEHVLGMAKLFPPSLIDNCRSRHCTEVPLTLDGATVTASVQFSAKWLQTPTGDCQILRLRDGADLMRVVDFDIIAVTPRELPRIAVDLNGAFCRLIVDPEPEEAASKLPAVDMTLPFSFKLPEALPTSLDTEQGSSIRYSITASLGDVAALPKAVHHFGVIQPIPSSIPSLTIDQTISTDRRLLHGCFCGKNEIKMTTHIDRRGYAPGEPMIVRIRGRNVLNVPVELRVVLVRTHRLQTPSSVSHFKTEFELSNSLRAEKRRPFSFDLKMPLPVVAPTFEGTGGDPLTWGYELVITAEARQRLVTQHCGSIIVAAIPTETNAATESTHHRSKAQKSSSLKDARVYSNSTNWEDIGMKGDPKTTLKYEPDVHVRASRALNKFVQNGESVESPFVSFYAVRAPVRYIAN